MNLRVISEQYEFLNVNQHLPSWAVTFEMLNGMGI